MIRGAALALLICCGSLPARAEVPVIHVQSSDYAMAKAFGQARATLNDALGAMEKRHGRFSPSFALKVALPVPAPERIEMIWVDTIRRDGKGFVAQLAGHPAHMPDKRIRDLVRFSHSQIADWAVQAVDGRYYGYYTTRVLLNGAKGPLAEEIRALLVPNPLPPEWRFNPSE
ncbi:Uncharacterized conserved protein YegJ, DUF2314 family [Tropicibacter naphthalenivorans]|uniref:DUF2314 domain-containing protein n=1 Tax=Tropicibacter naphthalenivorans TaxID=441103 RepID=A0A0P1G3Q5_9RHOB|nr:hypothetical protein TRN7648_00956 [Tropicibacter naphthalenivorans]SMC65927.1 Uncharacterized conserved protein YegJ, DUF2314 family [Tropicibacter naphthalenivorans]